MVDFIQVTIWGTPNCPICLQAREKLSLLFGLSSVDRDITPILTGEADRSDKDVMGVAVALHMNDGDYPILQVDKKFHPYPEALNEIRKLLRMKI